MMINKKSIALLRSIFGVDEGGNISIRIVDSTVEEPLENAINSSQSNRTLDSLIASSIVLDENGNPAIRISVVKFGETFRDRFNRIQKEQSEKKEKVRMKQIKESEKVKSKAKKEAKLARS